MARSIHDNTLLPAQQESGPATAQTIEQLTALHPSIWRGHQLGQYASERVPSGFAELDAQLPGGGWPGRNLIELLTRHHGIGELRFLVPALRRLAMQGRWIVFVQPPFMPVPHVLGQFGIPSHQVVLIQTDRPHDRLWAIEKLVKSNTFGALLVWLPEDQQLLNAGQLRRLQHHSAMSCGLSFIFRPMRAQDTPSPASLRLCLSAHSPTQLRAQIIKRRGPVMEAPLVLDLPTPASALPGEFVSGSQEQPYAMDSNLFITEPANKQGPGIRKPASTGH